jgi:cytochrome c oxidase accessory protein FixG
VQVCPTGIDIRDGLQYECIGCALCVDACNSVMDKMGYEAGLVRYTSEHQLAGGKTHWLRPRIIGYVVVLLIMVSVFSYNMFSRIPLELTIIRDRTQLFVTTDTGAIDNIYTLQLVNMDPESHTFEISIEGLDQGQVIGETMHTLNGGEVRSINLRVRVSPEDLEKPSTEFDFRAEAVDNESLQITHESRFVKPI